MTEKVSTLELRKRLGDILNRVALRHDQFVIERKGKPLAALVPVSKLEQLDRMARERLLEWFSRPPLVAMTQEEADRIANEAKHESRKRPRSGKRAVPRKQTR